MINRFGYLWRAIRHHVLRQRGFDLLGLTAGEAGEGEECVIGMLAE